MLKFIKDAHELRRFPSYDDNVFNVNHITLQFSMESVGDVKTS